MGERTAYRVKSNHETTPSLRKQWGYYKTEELKKIIIGCAKVLCTFDGIGEEKIGSGFTALRHDLEFVPGRLFLALCYVIGKTPFDEITNKPTDISDHGLFEIEIKKWNHWIIWHYDVKFEDNSIIENSKRKVLEVEFEAGKPVEKGIKFSYISDNPEW